MQDVEIEEALELAAGIRLKPGMFERKTAGRHDISVTRRQILLFLENLDGDMTVAEIRDQLEN